MMSRSAETDGSKSRKRPVFYLENSCIVLAELISCKILAYLQLIMMTNDNSIQDYLLANTNNVASAIITIFKALQSSKTIVSGRKETFLL